MTVIFGSPRVRTRCGHHPRPSRHRASTVFAVERVLGRLGCVELGAGSDGPGPHHRRGTAVADVEVVRFRAILPKASEGAARAEKGCLMECASGCENWHTRGV